ncbi:MAG: extracellular solute-binding protein [Eubacteriales bacterium]|nr:extracellular solute-binding protein [Eubacteriales bacterium]
MKKLVALFLFLALTLGMVGGVFAEVVELKIPHYKTGENVGAVFFMPQVERFNKMYEGKYHITIEELTQDMYAEKMKQLGQQKKLPAIIEGGEMEWIERAVIPNNMFFDWAPYLEEHPELKDILLEDSLAFNTMADGKVFSILLPVTRPMGMYYNGDMVQFSKVPGEMANWDELAAELGDNKMAFMTGENAWTTMLVYSSLIAAQEGGAELLRNSVRDKVVDFNQPIILKATEKLQELLQKYASANTVGAVYADAANAFMSKNAAVIANGSWMVGDFQAENNDKWSNGFDGKTVRGAVFPGNVALANNSGYSWWVPSTVSKEEQEAAIAFITFMCSPEELEAYMLAEGGIAPKMETSAEYKAEAEKNALLYEYVNAVNSETILAPSFGDCIPSSIANVEFGKLLPKLIDGSMSAEQFCTELSNKAAETLMD